MFGVPYHFLIVHFPVVLALAALFYDARRKHDAGYGLSMGAALGAGLAVVSGLMLSGGKLSELTVHAGSGIAGALLALVLAVLRYSAKARNEDESRAYPLPWLLIEIAAAAAVLIAAVSGHRAVLGF